MLSNKVCFEDAYGVVCGTKEIFFLPRKLEHVTLSSHSNMNQDYSCFDIHLLMYWRIYNPRQKQVAQR